MKLEVGFDGLRGVLDGVTSEIAVDATAAMRETTNEAKQELRAQVISAGLGGRLANTWRGESYPKSRSSVNPAGYIYSSAPDIISSFVRGATIRPVNGAKYLWIPTDKVPRARGRISRSGKNLRGGAMTPEEVENRFNTDFVVRPGRNGTLLAFIDVVRSLNPRGGLRPATPGRKRQGRFAKPELMFVLRRTVTMPQLLDLAGPAERWAERFDAAFTRRLGAR